jgi:hypothetical protein
LRDVVRHIWHGGQQTMTGFVVVANVDEFVRDARGDGAEEAVEWRR